jgi:hypothetical protein
VTTKTGKKDAPSLMEFAAGARVKRGLITELPEDLQREVWEGIRAGVPRSKVAEWLDVLGYDATKNRMELLHKQLQKRFGG